jgi:hypothetical protein
VSLLDEGIRLLPSSRAREGQGVILSGAASGGAEPGPLFRQVGVFLPAEDPKRATRTTGKRRRGKEQREAQAYAQGL